MAGVALSTVSTAFPQTRPDQPSLPGNVSDRELSVLTSSVNITVSGIDLFSFMTFAAETLSSILNVYV